MGIRQSIEQRERAALSRARRDSPELNASRAVLGRDVATEDDRQPTTMPEDSTAQDWLVAEAARPDFEDETVDGLSPLEEATRSAAEEPPADEPFEERVRRKAHEIWESEGGPHGRAEDHWRIAAGLVAEEIARDRADLPFTGEVDGASEEADLQENLGEFPELTDQGRNDG